jgi:hypothetical protein
MNTGVRNGIAARAHGKLREPLGRPYGTKEFPQDFPVQWLLNPHRAPRTGGIHLVDLSIFREPAYFHRTERQIV